MEMRTNILSTSNITEALAEAFYDVKQMREGKKPKKSVNELWAKIEEWKKEDEDV